MNGQGSIFDAVDDELRERDLIPDPGRPAPGAWHRNGTDTERAAALAAMPRKGSQRARVLERFQNDPYGWTDYELGEALGMFRWVAGTRRGELIRDGWPIVDIGERRPTDTGSSAIVWALRERPWTDGGTRGRENHGNKNS